MLAIEQSETSPRRFRSPSSMNAARSPLTGLGWNINFWIEMAPDEREALSLSQQ
jgi:hypothetical protein